MSGASTAASSSHACTPVMDVPTTSLKGTPSPWKPCAQETVASSVASSEEGIQAGNGEGRSKGRVSFRDSEMRIRFSELAVLCSACDTLVGTEFAPNGAVSRRRHSCRATCATFG